MKKLTAGIIMAISMLFDDYALAHANLATHGGTVQVAGDYSFELVRQNGSAIIFVKKRGVEMPTLGATGALTAFRGDEKKLVPLEAGIGNTLVSPGGSLAHWSQAVASITFPDRSVAVVRFKLN